MGNPMSILTLFDIDKSYKDSAGKIHRVLSKFSLEIAPGEIVWLRGESGSGKSTVLNIAGLLSSPDSGKRSVDGVDVTSPGPRIAAEMRKTKIGMVFQQGNLLPDLTAVENIMVASADGKTEEILEDRLAEFGLNSIAHYKAKQLSGGQQQRVAFCRALINDPVLVLADEPNSGLDEKNTASITDALESASRRGCAVLLASHYSAFETISTRNIEMECGYRG